MPISALLSATLSAETVAKLDMLYYAAIGLLGAGVLLLLIAIVLLISNRRKK